MTTYNKIIVCSPNAISGGPELLHQLVDALRDLGRNAFICYYPFQIKHECPAPYKIYNSPQTKIEDSAENLIILPETATLIAKSIKKANISIWWLSVDNYFHWERNSHLTDFIRTYSTLINWRLPLFKLRKYHHYAQSFYAKEFLQKNNINPDVLTDYISNAHTNHKTNPPPKKNIITFNPAKGLTKTTKLKEKYPDFDFVPIKNLNTTQVRDLLTSAKIYMDFGHHPGKDRLPREAALAGCCIITGVCGSAQFYEDIPIPKEYKLNDKSDSYLLNFRHIATRIFENFNTCSKDFDQYRSIIKNEPSQFKLQVESIFNK